MNECIQSPYPCATNAACTDTVGSFTCGPCNAGYTGNPNVQCTRLCCNRKSILIFYSPHLAVIDTCSPSPCDPLTTCTQYGPNQFTCGTCPAEYYTSFDGHGASHCTRESIDWFYFCMSELHFAAITCPPTIPSLFNAQSNCTNLAVGAKQLSTFACGLDAVWSGSFSCQCLSIAPH